MLGHPLSGSSTISLYSPLPTAPTRTHPPLSLSNVCPNHAAQNAISSSCFSLFLKSNLSTHSLYPTDSTVSFWWCDSLKKIPQMGVIRGTLLCMNPLPHSRITPFNTHQTAFQFPIFLSLAHSGRILKGLAFILLTTTSPAPGTTPNNSYLMPTFFQHFILLAQRLGWKTNKQVRWGQMRG